MDVLINFVIYVINFIISFIMAIVMVFVCEKLKLDTRSMYVIILFMIYMHTLKFKHEKKKYNEKYE